MRKIGVAREMKEPETVEITGFIPREPRILKNKDGELFKSFTLGVQEDEDSDQLTWYNFTAPYDMELKKGQNITVVAKIWDSYYTTKDGTTKKKKQGRID